MKRALPSLVLGSFCSVLAIQSAFAETQQPVTTLKKITVSADRIDQTAQKDSRAIDSVDREKLDEIQATSVAEAVKFSPNVSVAGGPIPGMQSVNIRGMEGNKVLQIIDGTRVNTNFNHRPSYLLDPALLSSMDIVKGPVSSLWGSGAIGGVVSQNTVGADDLIEEGETFGGLVKGGFNSNGDQWATTAAIAGKQGAIDWTLAGTHLDADQMKQGNGDTLYGTEARNSTGLAKLNWQINDANKVGLNYRDSNNDGHPPTIGGSDEQLNDDASLIDRKSRDQHLALSYNFNPKNNDLIDLDTKLYSNKTRIEEVNLNNGKDLSQIKTLGFSATNNSKINKLNLLSGIDGYEDSFDTDRPGTRENARPLPPSDAKTNTLGAFIYGDYQLLENVVLEGGLRYDQFKSEAKGEESNDKSAFSPSAAINWQALEWAKFSLRYDEAFRAPDVSELYMSGTHYGDIGGPTNIFIPNPNLKPETSRNIELKGDFNFVDVFADDQLNITASVFDNKVKDYIGLDVDPEAAPDCDWRTNFEGCLGTSRSINIPKARLKGFEIAANYQIEALSASLSYGQTRGTNVTEKQALSNIPADKWTAELGYALWAIDSKVGVRAIKTSDQKHLSDRDSQGGPYQGYTTTDFYASWEPTSESLEGLKVDFVVANAFDYNYRNAWASVYEAGRSVRLAAQYSF